MKNQIDRVKQNNEDKHANTIKSKDTVTQDHNKSNTSLY